MYNLYKLPYVIDICQTSTAAMQWWPICQSCALLSEIFQPWVSKCQLWWTLDIEQICQFPGSWQQCLMFLEMLAMTKICSKPTTAMHISWNSAGGHKGWAGVRYHTQALHQYKPATWMASLHNYQSINHLLHENQNTNWPFDVLHVYVVWMLVVTSTCTGQVIFITRS